MTLYALEEDEILIYAAEAEERRVYRCTGCHRPVKVRRGPYRVPHFYHLSQSPTCRLYSKSQDHLLAQLALQKILPAAQTILEKPFPEILRVADVVWEPYKLIFEIQCSLLTPHEAKQRMRDYQKVGYQIVWILDDRVFNRRILRPAEKLIRQTPCYYATLRKQMFPIFYDQFEIFHNERRIRRGQCFKVELKFPGRLPVFTWEEKRWPRQIIQKTALTNLFFHGDLIHKALLSDTVPALRFAIENFRALEILTLSQHQQKEKWKLLKKIVRFCFLEPLGLLMRHLLEKAAR
ncbi:MAG: hypothetical protein KGJ02_00120 [Verrucomicrobiota bacterium]|nr:hypothetical protein [Verrucomicrobiota bacterium]